jgi:hypothetical protein
MQTDAAGELPTGTDIEPIAGEPTRWRVNSATRKEFAFIVDSDWEGGWGCGCERFMVTGQECRHIRQVKEFLKLK